MDEKPREGWKLPEPPACCGLQMIPVGDDSPAPIVWWCKSCRRSQLWPIVEWPFGGLTAKTEALHSVGIRTMDRDGNIV